MPSDLIVQAGDCLRHREKVRESIRENIADIIAEESIIGKDKDRVIKVPLYGGIKEYRFIYGENAGGVGTGDGDMRPGQVVGKTGKDGKGKGEGQAGDLPGVDYYETDVTLEELIEIMLRISNCPTSSGVRYGKSRQIAVPSVKVIGTQVFGFASTSAVRRASA